MQRSIRYLLAVVAGVAATVVVAIEHDSIVLFAGTFVLYALTVGIWARFPGLLWSRRSPGDGLNVAAGVVAGGSSFCAMALAQGIGDTLHLGAVVMGFGLVWFGVGGGVWMVDNGEISLEPRKSAGGRAGDGD